MYTLSSVLGVGLVMLLLLRPGVMVTNDKNNMITNSIKEFRSTWNIFLTREFSILCITFLYVGKFNFQIFYILSVINQVKIKYRAGFHF